MVLGDTAEPIGALITEATEAAVHLVDVALLPTHRGCGLGTLLLHRVIEEAGPRPVRLHVAAYNPAYRLYERLGFRDTGHEGAHRAMERPPESAPVAPVSSPYPLLA